MTKEEKTPPFFMMKEERWTAQLPALQNTLILVPTSLWYVIFKAQLWSMHLYTIQASGECKVTLLTLPALCNRRAISQGLLFFSAGECRSLSIPPFAGIESKAALRNVHLNVWLNICRTETFLTSLSPRYRSSFLTLKLTLSSRYNNFII